MSNMVGCYRYEPTGEKRNAHKGEYIIQQGDTYPTMWKSDIASFLPYDIYKLVGTPDPQEVIDDCSEAKLWNSHGFYTGITIGYKTAGESAEATRDEDSCEPDIDIYYIDTTDARFYRCDFSMLADFDFDHTKDACLAHWKEEKGIVE